MQSNSNLVAAASSNVPVKTVDFTKDQTQSKQNNNGPISPQITFLASQGAHVPSMNTQQQPISRMFVNSEKSSMPQLMNYEAATKEIEQENNKSLWRWQYGLNANNESPAKNSISRSFGEGDDIMINFSDMTQEQYTNMIRSQMEANEDVNREINTPRFAQVHPFERNQVNYPYDQHQQQSSNRNSETAPKPQINFPHSNNGYYGNFNGNNIVQPRNENRPVFSSSTYPNLIVQTENNVEQTSQSIPESNVVNSTPQPDWHNRQFYENIKRHKENYAMPRKEHDEPKKDQTSNNAETLKVEESRYVPDPRSNLVTSKHFTPPSQTVTQSYDYDDDFFEVRKIKSLKPDKLNLVTKKENDSTSSIQPENIVTTSSDSENYNHLQNYNEKAISTTANETYNNWLYNNNLAHKDVVAMQQKIIPTTELPVFTSKTLKFSDFISHEEEKSSDFKPIYTTETVDKETTTTTTETSVEDMFNNNIFLKNLIRSDKPAVKHQNAIIEQPQKQTPKPEVNPEPIMEKSSRYMHQNPFSEVKNMRQKPRDISDILNYVSSKNHFESGKVKPKKQNGFPEHFTERKEAYYSNIDGEQKERESENNRQRNHQHEELRGIIKNYKVLQRNNIMNPQHNQPSKEINLVPYRVLQAPNLPPLGRAGPAAKSYLPPIYV